MEDEESGGGGELLVAVALTGSRKSKYILRWAMDKFLPEGNVTFRILHVYPKITVVPTPMGNWLPVGEVREDVVNGYRQETVWKKKKVILPYQQALKGRKIKSDIVVLESDDVAMALSLEINKLSIRHLVVGASSTSIFSRKNLTLGRLMGDNNLSTVISENAPSFCSVYVVADGKLQTLRPAESEPTVITVDSTNGFPTTFAESSGSASLTLGRILKSRPSSPRYPGSAAPNSFTNNSYTREPEPLQNNTAATKRSVRPSMDLNHSTFQETKNFGTYSAISQSSSSGDSGSWVSERTSPGGSLVGTPPTRSFTSTPPGGSLVGTPPTGSFTGTPPTGSFTGTPPTGSFTGTPPTGSFTGTPPGSYVGTPPAVSFAGSTPPGSFVGTPPAVSFADTTPPGSFVGTPATVYSSETPPAGFVVRSPFQYQPPAHSGAGASTGQNSELEKLRMELRHIEKMYELAQSNNINEKLLFPIDQLNDLSKERLEEALKLKEGKAKEMVGTENKNIGAQNGAVKSGGNAQRSTLQNKAETKAALEKEENENKLRQLLASPVAQYQKFTWKEIMDATSSLSEEFKIGMGAFGTVYKCKLHHTTVAVKVLHSKDTVTNKQFLQELEILTTIRHPHLLLLLGAVPEESCLVYEYMENGSLDDRLFQKDGRPPLPWYERLRICYEVASSLAFLHSTTPKPIIHRDLKPANILLDQNLVSKIGDAGLGTMINVEPTNESLKTMYKETSPVGTLCYIDPEYQRTGRVSTKSDIYALGVVILQLLTAKHAVGIAYLIEDAIDEGTLMEVLDPEAGNWPEKEALELALLGLQCAELRGRDRPDLREKVLPALERLKEVANKAREQASSALTALPAHFICPIGKDIMEDPYVAADGYTYDRTAIEQWLAENNTSPTTSLPLPHKFIMPNTTMLEAINQWKSARLPKC